jgi:prepilin-type N-terminal cleavage/methylation domain-containing protein
MIKILKSKKGMTLTELIAGMMLFAIITAAVSAVLAPMLRTYARANDLAELNTLLDNLANHIISDLSKATAIGNVGTQNIISITIDTDIVEYTVEHAGDDAGALLKRVNGSAPTPVFVKDFYKNKSVSFLVTPESSGSAYTLTVRILDRDNSPIPMISRDYAVRPLALNQYN